MEPLEVYEDNLLAKQLQGLSPTKLERYRYSVRNLLADLDKNDVTDITQLGIEWREQVVDSRITD